MTSSADIIDTNAFPVLRVAQSRERWTRESIQTAVPEVWEQIDLGPDLIPGITPDDAACRFLRQLQLAATNNPLALDVWMQIVGQGPLAPTDRPPVRVVWAEERTVAGPDGGALPADFMAFTRREWIAALRAAHIEAAAHLRAQRALHRTLAV